VAGWTQARDTYTASIRAVRAARKEGAAGRGDLRCARCERDWPQMVKDMVFRILKKQNKA